MWCHSRSNGVMGVRVRVVRDHGDWTTKEEISIKKRKEKKKNAPEGKPAQVAW